MILDVAGEVKFISEYCKSFMEKCQASLKTKEFFNKIKDLHQRQQYELPSNSFPIQIERLTTENELLPPPKISSIISKVLSKKKIFKKDRF